MEPISPETCTHLPAGLRADGRAHRLDGLRLADGTQTALAVALRLPGAQTLVVGRNMAVLVELHQIVIHALLLGLIPAVLLALAAGAVLSLRTVGRLRVLHQAIERIMHGGLGERLPAGGTRDDLDQLTRAMNRMLDEIERLVGEAKSVGDNIAHDLRTPLARVRTRLERGRRVARTREELCDVVDAAIEDLELTFGIVTALLRIAEIETGRRRAGFGSVDLAEIAQEAVEIYAPIAEDCEVSLAAETSAVPLVPGDRDLLMEAVANLVDNAIKFTPAGGAVRIAVSETPDGPALRIADTGPGIPAAERELVLRRFYRADKSRQVPGHGLGLSLVAAIVRLHDFRLTAGDGPGCVFTLAVSQHRQVGEKTAVPMRAQYHQHAACSFGAAERSRRSIGIELKGEFSIFFPLFGHTSTRDQTGVNVAENVRDACAPKPLTVVTAANGLAQ